MGTDHFIFHTERHTKRKVLVWALPLLYLIIFAQALVASEYLTDAAKKRKIDEMYEGYKKHFPKVKDFSAGQILQLMDRERIIFVDIRKTKEQAVSMINGAITEMEFRRNLSAYRDYIVIGYCTIGSRSGKLAQAVNWLASSKRRASTCSTCGEEYWHGYMPGESFIRMASRWTGCTFTAESGIWFLPP